MKYPNMSWGKMEAVINLVGGEEGVQRLIARELVVVEASSLQPIKTKPRDFAVWKTVTLGLKRSPKGYRKAIEKKCDRIGNYASQILNKTKVSRTEVELDLVVVTVGELGFKDGARLDKIYARAIELGLELCPAEVGPALRLLHKDQPRGERLRIGMEPIAALDGSPGVFGVGSDNGDRWLDNSYGSAGSVWSTVSQWVFVRPRK